MRRVMLLLLPLVVVLAACGEPVSEVVSDQTAAAGDTTHDDHQDGLDDHQQVGHDPHAQAENHPEHHATLAAKGHHDSHSPKQHGKASGEPKHAAPGHKPAHKPAHKKAHKKAEADAKPHAKPHAENPHAGKPEPVRKKRRGFNRDWDWKQDRRIAEENGWIWTGAVFTDAFAKARETGKPLMIVIRCPP